MNTELTEMGGKSPRKMKQATSHANFLSIQSLSGISGGDISYDTNLQKQLCYIYLTTYYLLFSLFYLKIEPEFKKKKKLGDQL